MHSMDSDNSEEIFNCIEVDEMEKENKKPLAKPSQRQQRNTTKAQLEKIASFDKGMKNS